MDDIVIRLRYVVYDDVNAMLIEAADEIERLRALIKRVVDADVAWSAAYASTDFLLNEQTEWAESLEALHREVGRE